VEVETFSDPGAVVERAGGFLLADEARHNLPLGILTLRREHPDVYPELAAWIVTEGADVVAVAVRTPPHNLVVARPAAAEALHAIVDAIADELPGVVGAVPEIDSFTRAWTARRGVVATTRFEQRIYALRGVVAPTGVPGSMRLAHAGDRELVLSWMTAFTAEALHGLDDPLRVERSVDARLQSSTTSGIALWEVEGRVVSLAGFGGATPNGLRIGPVYTPRPFRGRGYGSAVTAGVSRLVLDRGKRFCFLYTDLANPTSNAIYRRIGYEPVCDSREIAFAPPSG
jgi:predicted GNAT family acetyltransferase